MNKLIDLITDFLEGHHIRHLLEATGIDRDTFLDKIEWAKFSAEESRIIRKTIKEITEHE